MSNLPEVFTGVAPSKSEIEQQCEAIIAEINNGGNVNPLRVATTMKSLETAMKTIKSGISEAILDEAQKQDSKTFEFDGHSIGVRESGVKYDYSGCNDPVMDELLSKMDLLKKEIKERETFLKGIKKPMTIVDDESGEVSQVFPPAKSSTTSVTITLKK